MDYEPNDSLWDNQEKYIHHVRPPENMTYRIITSPIPVQNLSEEEKKGVLKVVDMTKLMDLKHILNPAIAKMLIDEDYNSLFTLYMRYGLSCFALDLAEKQLPEKLDEVMEKFPDLEGRVAAGAK